MSIPQALSDIESKLGNPLTNLNIMNTLKKCNRQPDVQFSSKNNSQQITSNKECVREDVALEVARLHEQLNEQNHLINETTENTRSQNLLEFMSGQKYTTEYYTNSPNIVVTWVTENIFLHSYNSITKQISTTMIDGQVPIDIMVVQPMLECEVEETSKASNDMSQVIENDDNQSYPGNCCLCNYVAMSEEDLENHIDEKHEDIFQVPEDRVTQVQALLVDASEEGEEYQPSPSKRRKGGMDNSSSSHDTQDLEVAVSRKIRREPKEKSPDNATEEARVVLKPKRRPKIVVNRENPTFGIPAVYQYQTNSFLPEPATVMQDSSLPSNDIMVVRNPTEACFFIYRDIDIPMDEALKQIHKREFKKHLMSQNSKIRQSNDGCEGFLFYGTKILPGTTNQIYRVGALQRKTFMHRELRSIIVQYLGDFEYTLDNENIPKPYKIGKCPEQEMSKNLSPELKLKIIRQPKAKIVITKRDARGRTHRI